MPENDRLIELVAQMLDEMRLMHQEQRETNRGLDLVEKQLGWLKEEQAKINVLLQEHTRHLMKIAELLDERVVHWGDKVQSDGDRGVTEVVSKLK